MLDVICQCDGNILTWYLDGAISILSLSYCFHKDIDTINGLLAGFLFTLCVQGHCCICKLLCIGIAFELEDTRLLLHGHEMCLFLSHQTQFLSAYTADSVFFEADFIEIVRFTCFNRIM